jgi:hypothetical protein
MPSKSILVAKYPLSNLENMGTHNALLMAHKGSKMGQDPDTW